MIQHISRRSRSARETTRTDAMAFLLERPFGLIVSLFLGLFLSLTAGCTGTSLSTQPADLGSTSSGAALRKSLVTPGPIVVEKVLAANWVINRAGVINLKNPMAIEEGLSDGPEPIEIYFYHIKHPQFGSFLIDSGVAESFKNPASSSELSWVVKKAMNTSTLEPVSTTADGLEQTGTTLNGVFLTHIHLDHIFGMPDIAGSVPVYTGPGEAAATSLQNLFSRGTTDRLLKNVSALSEWQFEKDPDGEFAAVLDIFGDGSLWAVHSPGHTPGSTAFVARTASGPHLITGDASHTAWGWNHSVEPGTFSADIPRSAESLDALETLVKEVKKVKEVKEMQEAGVELCVHPGHQSLNSCP